MPVVEILKGLPGSGKSTYARDKVRSDSNWVRVNKDDLRSMIFDGHYTGKNERRIINARDSLIVAYMQHGLNIVVDDTNLNPSHEMHLRDLIKHHNTAAKVGGKWQQYDVTLRFFEIELEEAVKRDLQRPVSVGRDVIEKMYYEWLFKPEPVEPVKGAPWAVLCDLDGTLALFNNRGPYEWMKCETDHVSQPVLEILQMVEACAAEAGDDVKIIIMSGRDEECRTQTEKWLAAHEVPYDHLIMRVEGDTRPDDLIKRELFDKYIRHDFNVKFVLDDRRRVKRMWINMGLFVFDTNQTSIIF